MLDLSKYLTAKYEETPPDSPSHTVFNSLRSSDNSRSEFLNSSVFKQSQHSLITDFGRLDPSLYITEKKDQFQLNVALKYSIVEDIISVIIFKCTLLVNHSYHNERNNSENPQLSSMLVMTINIFVYSQPKPTFQLYSRISLLHKDKEVIIKRRKAYQSKALLDFSKDHKFKLNGENLDDLSIKIQIKKSAPPLQKSKSLLTP